MISYSTQLSTVTVIKMIGITTYYKTKIQYAIRHDITTLPYSADTYLIPFMSDSFINCIISINII